MSLSDRPPGTHVVRDEPRLSAQTGSPPDLVLRWNAMPAAHAQLDLVLHLHGYAQSAAGLDIAAEKVAISGLDFGDPDRPDGQSAGRSRPTLGLIPRGRYFGGRTGCGYDFPVMSDPATCRAVVNDAVTRFRALFDLPPLTIGRRVLTAHSGGGAALMAVAAGFEPHEIHVFDALYGDAPALAAWAEHAIAQDASALRRSPGMGVSAYMAEHGRALRVAYVPATGTAPASEALGRHVADALARAPLQDRHLARWYRVEPVAIDHARIPRALGWRWLADAAADE